MIAVAHQSSRQSIRRHLLVGMLVALLLVVGLGGWSATTKLAGAVIASGRLIVESNVKKVQHPTGGIVKELRVREGSHVEEGELLVRLDDTVTRANLAIVTKSLDEMAVRKAREEAERDGADDITLPPELLARKDEPELSRVISGESRLFKIRRAAREGQRAQLKERITQLRAQIMGQSEQAESKARESQWVAQELEGVRDLWDKRLVPFSRVALLERETAQLSGERSQLIASVAQSRDKIAETELQILQIDADMRAEVGRDLADIRGKSSEAAEKQVAAEDALKHIDIRSPCAGTVFQLDVHTIGGVISPGESIMLIVPDAGALTVEAQVPPNEIDQIKVGGHAVMRFQAFNQRVTPEVNGTVSFVSPDIALDKKSNAAYFAIRIAVPHSEIARLGGRKLIAGMPVEVFVQTNMRTVLSYLVKPLYEQSQKTFRER